MTSEYMCALCNKPVSLEDGKANEKGQTVHEDCYLKVLTAPATDDTKPQVQIAERAR